MLKSDYFKKINTYRKAYFLGFILGDGAITMPTKTSYMLTITIQEQDKYILDEFAKDIGSDRQPYKLKNYYAIERHLWRFNIAVKDFVANLMNLGITPRKSLTAENISSVIPEKYRPAFFLGIYDADGSFTFSKELNLKGLSKRQYVQIRCTDSIASGFISEFSIKSYCISRKDAIPNFIVGNKQEIINMLSKMYHRCPVFLTRKKDKYLKLLNQVQTIS